MGNQQSIETSHRAFRLNVKEGTISNLVLQISDYAAEYAEMDWQKYSGKIPGGLAATDNRESVIKKLGEPTTTDGDTWAFESYELSVDFEDSKIESIIVKNQ